MIIGLLHLSKPSRLMIPAIHSNLTYGATSVIGVNPGVMGHDPRFWDWDRGSLVNIILSYKVQ